VLGHHQGAAGRLTVELYRHLDRDLLAPPHDQQVDVVERVADRVTLDRLGQRQRGRPVADLDVEQLVHAAVPDRRGELPGRQSDVARLLAVAVQDRGNLARPAGTAGTTLAELGAWLGADLYLGHGKTPDAVFMVRAGCAVRGRTRCEGMSPKHRVDHGARRTVTRLARAAPRAPSPWQPHQRTRARARIRTGLPPRKCRTPMASSVS
jgi:hypothetical protein